MTTRRSRNVQGPQFTQYFSPVLTTLKELGGSGRPDEVTNRIISSQPNISEREKELLNGTPRIAKNIHWARFYLAKAGYIDGSSRGVWILTEKGRATPSLAQKDVLEIFSQVQERFGAKTRVDESSPATLEQEVEHSVAEADLIDKYAHRKAIASLMNNFTSKGFEEFCQRLLRESGFEEVKVTGRSGDGGIDGHGILKINHFVSFKVAFQCKRYSSPVGSSIIRDFRGSIMGRADKGILITTNTFTLDARNEAVRDGATPIELVDSDKIIELLENLELGLEKKETIIIYKVADDFFKQYQL